MVVTPAWQETLNAKNAGYKQFAGIFQHHNKLNFPGSVYSYFYFLPRQSTPFDKATFNPETNNRG